MPADQVADISAPLLLHYAGLDERTNAGIGEFREALEASRKDYAIHMYEGVNHAFNNDTDGRYDAAAADLAWGRTKELFKQHLGERA
jgi:carboxymethylenebutenolidase